MRFECPAMQGDFEIPDPWWDAAGIRGFEAKSTAYRWPVGGEAKLVPLNVVRRPLRNVEKDFGGFDRVRLVSVLSGIAASQALPPVDMEMIEDDKFSHGLRDGYHRFFASIAAGFTHIPARIMDRLY